MAAISAAFLLVLFVVLPVLGARTHRSGVLLKAPREAIYLSAVITQWVIAGGLLIVLWLEGRQGLSVILSHPIGVRRTAVWTVVTLLAAFVVVAVILVVRHLTRTSESKAVQHLLPVTSKEKLMFALLVSPTAGFVEEMLYRGYAIHRLAPVLGDEWLAAAVSSVVFALGHIYQGRLGIFRAATLGMILAAPYVVTGSLLPSILAHALIDLISGVLTPRKFLAIGEERAESDPASEEGD